MTKQYRHYLITRFNIRIASMLTKQLDAIDVSRDEKYLDERFRLFFDYTVPSVVKQTVKEFIWVVLFSDNTPDKFKIRVKELEDCYSFIKIIYVKDDEESSKLLNDFISVNECDYCITSRVDNDDAIALTYIEAVRSYVENNEPEKYALIFNNGYQYEEKSGVLSKYHFPKNHFSTLVSPYEKDVDTILNYGHMDIGEQVPLAEVENDNPLWLEIVHETNVSNRMHHTSKDIITAKDAFEQFGIDNKLIASGFAGKLNALLLIPGNAVRLLKQYGIKKTFAKIFEKLKR